MDKYSELYVNHHWKIISNSLKACKNCPHSKDMREVTLNAAERLVYISGYTWMEI